MERNQRKYSHNTVPKKMAEFCTALATESTENYQNNKASVPGIVLAVQGISHIIQTKPSE